LRSEVGIKRKRGGGVPKIGVILGKGRGANGTIVTNGRVLEVVRLGKGVFTKYA